VSDMVLGAVIGVVGAIVGAIIIGVISYFNNRQQINARKAELKEQLEHQQHEARRSLRAEDRKQYLVPLRETTTKWVVELTRMIEQTNSIGRVIKRPKVYGFLGKKDSVEPQKQALEAIQGRMKKLEETLEDLHGQVHDEELSQYIDTLLLRKLQVHNNSFPILHSEILTWLKTEPGKSSTESLDDALQKNRRASLELRKQLRKVNKRIEDLLVDDETK
jgi:hypothetical protein